MGSTYIKKGDKIIEIPSNDKLCETIREKLEYQDELINRYKSLYEEAKSESYKDNELSKLKEQVDDLNNQLITGFGITADEQNNINNWIRHHNHDYGKYPLDYSYNFVRTPLGVVGKVQCVCGKEFVFKDI